ncbi:class I SAM-dependent methyltransferase [Desulfonatronum lacustre]|uniref:class I SAM-dependent methyltransferase n=1 Tax=Desulfonatronum lacustre TaxID=66849 RepID=UPI0004B2C15D|nr:rRNA adenine N-6-methyltransferase family protein [Desulfonatronum lacustre]SMP46302.1 Phospholipid N-methyltransferase [Desulfonatronum zhilinae]
MSTVNYVKCFLRDKNVASITPTSPFGVKRVCKKIDFSQANVIVEYGPGAGVFTEYLLKKMRPGAHLVLIERNKDMFKCLTKAFRSERVHIFNDSVENVGALVNGQLPGKPDYIISGIPFSYLDQQTRQEIIHQTHQILAENGKFLAYQTFYQKDDHLFVHLEHFFRNVKSEFELLNIPPMRIYEAVK